MNHFSTNILIVNTLFIMIFLIGCNQEDENNSGRSDAIKKQNDMEITNNLPVKGNWKLVWNDEFDGEALDTSKWDYRLHIMQVRHNTWTKEGAELDGKGHLLLKLYEKDGQFYSSHLQTGRNYLDRPGDQYGKSKFVWPIAEIEPPKFVHSFGYYELRCKFPTQEGWWAAFWIQSPVIGSSLKPEDAGVEIDVMESFSRDGIISHNIHWNGYGNNHKHAGSGPRQVKPSDDGFHTFGFHWSESGYVFYVDGEISWQVDGPVSRREQFILISTECKGYREGEPSPVLKEAILPDYFVVDYIRVYDEVMQ